jgi:hypothetical protein
MSTNWRDEAKALEQQLMAMQDRYAELAWALRFACWRLLG